LFGKDLGSQEGQDEASEFREATLELLGRGRDSMMADTDEVIT
jgi:hypothetical protein